MENPMENQENIFTALTNVIGKAHQIDSELTELKMIIFSDHHRGRKDGADDFARCQANYERALDYYKGQDHTLTLLGDVEEFWENSPRQVMHAYKSILAKEAEFYKEERFLRVWGNHDDMWSFSDAVKKHFHEMYPGLKVYEAIKINLTHEGQLLGNALLVHGHQGTLLSEKLGGFSRLMVRYVWRNIQRVFKIASTTPSKSTSLRSALDNIMYNWANNFNNQIVICGHTHDAIFMSSEELVKANSEIRALKMKLTAKDLSDEVVLKLKDEIESKRDRIRHFKEMEPNIGGTEERKPVYFNTGCCSYSDGSITGIEICDGTIRLVEWSDERQTEPFVIADHNLLDVYKAKV